MRRLLPVITALLLSACTVQRTAVYDPREYAPYAGTGTGKITGQAFLKTVGGDVKYAAGNMITLHPVTSLTREWFEKMVVQGVPLGAGNPHSDDLRRLVQADAEGRFTFDHLPPGDYYVTTNLTWGVPTSIGVTPTGGIAHAKTHVVNGQTTQVIVTR
jgi:hypothetical protein